MLIFDDKSPLIATVKRKETKREGNDKEMWYNPDILKFNDLGISNLIFLKPKNPASSPVTLKSCPVFGSSPNTAAWPNLCNC